METNATTPVDEAASSPGVLGRRLDLSIPIADLDKDIDQRLRQVSRNLKRPGFRPGKVPFNIVKQQYGQEAYVDALNELLGKAFNEAAKAQEMRVAGSPKIEQKETESTTHLEFTAIFEVYPEIGVIDLSNVEIERPTLEIGAAELESTLNVLRQQRIRYTPVERAAAVGDRVIVDFLGRKDGQPFQGGEGKDHSFVLGEGAMLADFENAVVGMKAGEAKTFSLSFPADYHARDLAGQAVDFDLTVKEVSVAIQPAINAEFARSLGITDGDVDRMRAEIETNLKREVKNRLRARVKNQVMDALLRVHPVEIPKALVEADIDHLMEDTRQDMERRSGRQLKGIPMQREWFADRARRRVSLGLLLSGIVKDKGLSARPEQIRAVVEEAAQSYEHPEEVIRWYYAQPQRLAEIEGVVIEDNVVEWALSSARVVDKAIAFEELMGRRG
ncbi:MAG: trigger factor [Candidatus Accumulibacter sp.]|jgi:trigger factor|nr:trigger factor [Accumulibacter sp.]